MRVQFANIGGIRTRYASAGEGPPVLLLHGIGLSADCFIRNIEPLAERFSVYAVDLLGHGFTDAAPFKGLAPQVVMAEHIAALADELGLERYSVIGSSFGAHVAAHIYLKRPGRVARLGLVGSGSVFHSNQDQRDTLAGSLANGRKAMTDPTLESCRLRLEKIVFDPACIPPEVLWSQLIAYAYPDRLEAYEAAIRGTIECIDDPASRVLSRLEDIACPAWIVVGQDDIRASVESHLRGAQRMPDATVSLYERCGHLPFLEYPERFNSEAVSFLSANSKKKEK